MPFWVYGRDSETGEPDQFFSQAATVEAARAEATAQGMVVERVDPDGEEHSAEAETAALTAQEETAPSERRCIKCGLLASGSARFCSGCGTLLPDEDDIAKAAAKPAGFWIRVGASLVDALVLLPLGLVGIAALSAKNLPLLVVVSIPGLIYKPLMESYFGATLGKMAVGVKVTDASGENLTLGAAYVRFVPFLLSQVISLLGIFWLFSIPELENASGFMEIAPLMNNNPFRPLDTLMNFVVIGDCLTVAFANRKRAVHDMLAGSFCIRKAV